MRYSRLGGTILLVFDFDPAEGEILLSLHVRRGRQIYPLDFQDGNVPDNIVVNEVWYNLYSNHEEVQSVLNENQVMCPGPVTLGQYIRIRQVQERNPVLEIVDHACSALSDHPTKEDVCLPPSQLRATLYPYQQRGYQWMRFIAEAQCGCILGDEMGLGKTLQVIALITARKQQNCGPALIVAPVSLLENWRREFEKFTEGLHVYVHHGPKRTGYYVDLQHYDAVILSYHTVSSDLSMLRMIKWDLLIADEAQYIKNPMAARSKVIRRIPRRTAIAVTGTPLENHMTDLWSLLDFIAPNCFGSLSEFEQQYPDDLEGARKLEPILTPLMIRRRVTEVAQDLPDRVDIPQVLLMSDSEAQIYAQQREQILEEYRGRNPSLHMLQKLRMFCTHPALLDGAEYPDPAVPSGKYARLVELLDEIIATGEKTILFTSYNRMFGILEQDIPRRFGISVLAINGSTPPGDRQPILDAFSAVNGPALLVLNPRAAGAGLNITAASRVIHYTLEWNPALEDQASARAYRRGQDKTVFVYRLYYKDTVEEILNERIEKKRSMAQAAVIGTDGSLDSQEDIVRALMMTPGGVNDGKQNRLHF